jgi:hypothetical protein
MKVSISWGSRSGGIVTGHFLYRRREFTTLLGGAAAVRRLIVDWLLSGRLVSQVKFLGVPSVCGVNQGRSLIGRVDKLC